MNIRRFMIASVVAAGMTGGANAAVLGFDLEITGDINIPVFTLDNTSDMFELINFRLTVGNTNFNFDGFDTAGTPIVNPPDGTSTPVDPDTNILGGIRSDQLELSFTDFDPGESITFAVDVDPDSANVSVD